MKNLIVAFLIVYGINSNAQRIVEKEIDYQNESVKMEFDLASSIQVKTWDRASILVKASIETEDEEIKELYDLNVKRNGATLEICSNSKEIFGMKEGDRLVVNRSQDHEINYTIHLPEGAELELSSIAGDVTSEYLKGNIAIALITGNIDIKEFEGALDLKTVSGRIDLPLQDTSFKAKTVTGKIYAHADPNIIKKDKFVGQEMSLDPRNAKNRLNLNTVTGDIHLQ